MGRFFLVAGLIISALLLINFPILYSYLALLSVLILAFMAFSYHTFEEKHNFTCAKCLSVAENTLSPVREWRGNHALRQTNLGR